MKYLVFLFICLWVGIAACVRDEEPEVWSLAPGDDVPAFSVNTIDGAQISTSNLVGHVSVICLFDVSCKDCRSELPILQDVYNSFHNTDVCFLCISRGGGEERVRQFWNELDLTMPVCAQPDATIYHLFADAYVPRIYISDASGIIRKVFVEKVGATELTDAIRTLSTQY